MFSYFKSKAYFLYFSCFTQPSRNAILDEARKWKFPIPYILANSLGTHSIPHFDQKQIVRASKTCSDLVFNVYIIELNAKGVILQAFDEYRLQSCVDFKPYEGERSYISFSKQDG